VKLELPSRRLSVLIRELRLERSWSQETLAEKAGLHRNFISLIERGRNQPSVDSLFQIAAAFEMAAAEMVERISISSDVTNKPEAQ
jgi:transcriptional regulator with XRE-family HTH domain